jgi:TolA-binding protein
VRNAARFVRKGRMLRFAGSLLVLAMIAGPAFSPAAQNKNDIVSMQRDIADLADKLSKLQKSQDDKMQAIQAMVQQSMEASAKVTGSLSALQTSLTNAVSQSLAEQQKKNSEQHADINAKLDTLMQNQGAVSETVSQFAARLKEMNGKLDNLNELVKTLNAPPSIPAPVHDLQGSTGAPAGWSAFQAFSAAKSDYTAGRFEMAITGFLEYIKYAPHEDENAPNAQYYIAQSYYGLKQYDDAAQAFGDVVDKFAANPKTCESRYMRGVSLQDAKHKEDALGAYKEFQNACPADPNREAAHEHILQLSAPARANSKGKGKGK